MTSRFHQPNSLIAYCLMSLLGLITACTLHQNSNKRFRPVPTSETHITFSNPITETDTFNILNFHYIYNGGGVGVGDFDKNGLPDLVFSGNQVSSELYLNQGNLNFKNISQIANFQTEGWATGVSIIDINADGWQDIYISIGGLNCDGNCHNQLFIHQGLDENKIPQFKEMAAEYGLDDGLYTQQTAFFDYDLDGDLDVYLLHNVIDRRDKNAPSAKKFINVKSRDRLLENQMLSPLTPKGEREHQDSVDNNLITETEKKFREPENMMSERSSLVGRGEYPTFKDISDSIGITHRGYGLGITLNDFNQDGYPDIYVANDFLSDDLLYISQTKNQQFSHYQENAKDFLKHQSYNSMGVDVADVNNDALPDICVLDMMPEYHERQKNMLGFMNYDKFLMTLRADYAPQFIRNVLQINNGFLNDEPIPFSEVGYMAGMYNTDWSWTPLLADFDNDGDRDLYVTNGYGKDITDLDFINYTSQASPFGTKENRNKELFEKVQQMKSVTMPNYFFENTDVNNAEDVKDFKNLSRFIPRFQNRSDEWTNKVNSISNGAVYADLDNDGDLDIVVNNIDEAAFVLENQTVKAAETKANFLKIQLKGTPENSSAIGTKIHIWTGGRVQAHYQSPVRGYLSSVEDVVHFGLGQVEKVDSLTIVWPNGQVEAYKNIEVNQTMLLVFRDFTDTKNLNALLEFKSNHTLKDVKDFKNLSHLLPTHQENPYQDFDAQPLLLHQHSRQGPCIATANIDGKAGDEIFIGGAKGFPSRIFYQKDNGDYFYKTLADSASEDTDAAFFDFDKDGDLDLYIVSGGTEFKDNAPEYRDRLYLNDGKGNFSQNPTIQIPAISSGSCVIPADYDKDGDIDLFIGGRVQPRNYPTAPKSYLLVNHNGQFIDHTNKLAAPLSNIGMVTDAAWIDDDGDGWQDLVIVGEWMPITILKNEKGIFKNIITVPNSSGLWNTISVADFDKDGDSDFMIGNLGENARLQASPDEPLALYADDFDKNGSPDPLIGQFYLNKKGERHSYPIHARDDVVKQLVKVKARYVKYADFGQVTFPELFQTDLDDTAFLKANYLKSAYIENTGDGQFKIHTLPRAAQVAPVQSILVDDFDEDGHLDALLSGNDYSAEKNGGWYDAFNGLLLKGLGDGQFEAVPTSESGFYVPGDGRDMVQFKDINKKSKILVGQNTGDFLMYH